MNLEVELIKITLSTIFLYISLKFETKRCLKVRFEEHCKTEGTNMTEVGKRLAESPGHTVLFEDVKILSFESHTRKRRILESIFIQESKFKLLNDNLRSIPL